MVIVIYVCRNPLARRNRHRSQQGLKCWCRRPRYSGSLSAIAQAKGKDVGLGGPTFPCNLTKPLRPLWTTPDVRLSRQSILSRDHHQIICCTSSRRVVGAELTENGYIQGAGDDSEGWAKQLTAELFWSHHQSLLGMSDEQLNEWCASCDAIVESSTECHHIATTNLCIGTINAIDSIKSSCDGLIICQQANGTAPIPPSSRALQLQLTCSAGKTGSRQLRRQLSQIPEFLNEIRSRADGPRIVVVCPTGRDLSVGVALVILCLAENSSLTKSASISKTMIRRNLAIISASKPNVSPSRATLQSVHAFLMPP